MIDFDQQRLLSGLMLSVIALFLASGSRPLARWRRQLRRAAIALFAVALTLTFVHIGIWLTGSGK